METVQANLKEETRLPLDAEIERVSYFNEETGQCILEIRSGADKESFFVSTHLPWAVRGARVSGSLTTYDSHRLLWNVKDLVLKLPETEKGIRRFLKAEALSAIGPKLVDQISKHFKTQFFRIIKEDPAQLLLVKGVGEKKKKQIAEDWTDFENRIRFKEFLFSSGFPLSWFSEVWKVYGLSSLEQFLRRPYEVGEEFRFNFDLIDNYSLRRGFLLDSLARVSFGLTSCLWNFFKQGHCAYPEENIIQNAMQLLNLNREVIEENLESVIIKEKFVVEIVNGTTCLYFKPIWLLEKKVAHQLTAFNSKQPPFGWVNFQKMITWAQDILQIQLAPLQKEAIETSLSSALSVITGGPGTGKTTLIRSFVTILQTQFLKFALCSPTGRAAQRLSETTGVPAQTIHRLLRFDSLTGQFFFSKNNKLNLDLILIDEASMLDLELMSHLLDALPEKCALIFVGDADQLPSVGAGNVLQSIISSERFPVVRLQQIYRQKDNSFIKENASRINNGLLPISDPASDFQIFSVDNAEQARSTVFHLLDDVIPKKHGYVDLEDVQILVPLNQGPIGAQALNQEIQKRKHRSLALPQLKDFIQEFHAGDKVMALKNDYQKDIFNGDVGVVLKVDYIEQYIDIDFAGRFARFSFNEMNHLTLAYAISVHKAQGSEYKIAIVILTEEHLPLAQRHLVYTAITRGKEKVFLVTKKSALIKALKETESRWERLTSLLKKPALRQA